MFPWRSIIPRGLFALTCAILSLGIARTACAQLPLFNFDWYQPLFLAAWMQEYWEDDASDEGVRLASIPEMFGDTFTRGGDFLGTDGTLMSNASTVALAGGSRGLKPAEHNKALPMNRIYLAYHHFHNAVQTTVERPVGSQVAFDNASIDQFTLGLESRFGQGLWSVELRMPFTAGYDFSYSAAGDSTENRAGRIGNLSVLLKRLVYYDPETAVSLGLGVETPTGSDYRARINDNRYRMSNDAVHLVPYAAVLHSPSERAFFHGFAALDLAANGNRVRFDDGSGPVDVGKFNDQTLLYLDLGAGYWLYRNPQAPSETGLAVLGELHYTGTLQDTDVVTGPSFTFANLTNRRDVVNVTAAIHAQLNRNTSLRVGGVFPVGGSNNRFFDAEVAAQLIRWY